jgi:hypothetical protein
MFGWFRKRMDAVNTWPEARWTVEVAGDTVQATDPDGTVTTLVLSEMSGVVIETNDTGPWGADVWWLLFGADDRVAVAYPQGATGEQTVLDRLTCLPGFDHGRMMEAMRSTSNAVFPVWRRQGAPPV